MDNYLDGSYRWVSIFVGLAADHGISASKSKIKLLKSQISVMTPDTLLPANQISANRQILNCAQ
jgi:hypothetical protein